MKNLFATVFAVVIAFTATALLAPDAEAKRLGGGGSVGMKRNVTPAPTQNATAKPAQPATAPAAQPAGKRNWLGPIAGLAAGLGIAALLSHFGLGEGMANILMIALLAFAAIFAFKFFFRKKEQAGAMQYAGAGAPYATPERVEPSRFDSGSAANVGAGDTPSARDTVPGAAGDIKEVPLGDTPTANIPADFDAAGFVRQAKLNYIRLQAANDRGDMDDIRNFTTPEMFAEIQMQYQERGRGTQETDVQQLDATVLDVSEEAGRYVVSVRFFGRIREEAGGVVEPLDEVWHLTKPMSGGGWLIAGIQQFQ